MTVDVDFGYLTDGMFASFLLWREVTLLSPFPYCALGKEVTVPLT